MQFLTLLKNAEETVLVGSLLQSKPALVPEDDGSSQNANLNFHCHIRLQSSGGFLKCGDCATRMR